MEILKKGVLRGLIFGVFFALTCGGFGKVVAIGSFVLLSAVLEHASDWALRVAPAKLNSLNYFALPFVKAGLAFAPLFLAFARLDSSVQQRFFQYKGDMLGIGIALNLLLVGFPVWVFVSGVIQVRRELKSTAPQGDG